LLSVCCDRLVFVFKFCRAFWLWMLLTGSGDELCGPLPALSQVVAYQWPAVGPPAFLAFVYWKFTWRLAPSPFPLLLCAFNFQPSLLCASFNLLFIQFFVCGGGQPTQGAILVYPRGGWRNTTWCLVLTCLVCRISPKQVWNQCMAAVGALLFSQCNMEWRSFPLERVQWCWSFDSPWCFISAKCGFSVSARFLNHRAHAVCFCILVIILDLPI
jgi:hypothetical protein